MNRNDRFYFLEPLEAFAKLGTLSARADALGVPLAPLDTQAEQESEAAADLVLNGEPLTKVFAFAIRRALLFGVYLERNGYIEATHEKTGEQEA